MPVLLVRGSSFVGWKYNFIDISAFFRPAQYPALPGYFAVPRYGAGIVVWQATALHKAPRLYLGSGRAGRHRTEVCSTRLPHEISHFFSGVSFHSRVAVGFQSPQEGGLNKMVSRYKAVKNRLPRLGNCTHQLEWIRRPPPTRRSYNI